MDVPDRIDDAAMWAAFAARDRAFDGRFVAAVRSTGIYCRSSCPARRPARDGVVFFADGASAEVAGFRACLRCRPREADRDRAAVAAALRRIADAEAPLSLTALAAGLGYPPRQLHRLFVRATGVTPAAYARARRAEAVADALRKEASVTDALYAAGYNAPSRFYADAGRRLGMTPGAWRRGGAGATIRWTIAATSLGPLLIAATGKGLCRVAFDETETDLRARFPNAEIAGGDDALMALAVEVVALAETPGRDHDLPLDVQGTAFQEAVWRALRSIPAGASMSYADLAAAAGNPKAVRAAGSACGANPVALVVPCHRVLRRDGGPGGYAWGLDRKRALRDREAG